MKTTIKSTVYSKSYEKINLEAEKSITIETIFQNSSNTISQFPVIEIKYNEETERPEIFFGGIKLPKRFQK